MSHRKGEQFFTGPKENSIWRGLIYSLFTRSKNVTLTVEWGAPGSGTVKQAFVFKNPDTLMGFLDGIEAATGWLYATIHTPKVLSGPVGEP